jgi:hypothetical protein
MRTIVFLVLAFFGLFLSSCNYDNFLGNKVGPGAMKTVIDTFTYSCVDPVLEDRYGCNGKFLHEPKVAGWKTTEKELNQEVLCSFTDQDLKDAGYVYTGKDPLYTEGIGPFWDLLGWIILIIIAILLLWLLLWLLKKLLNWFSRQNQSNSQNQGLRDRQTGQPIQADNEPQNLAPSEPSQNPQGVYVPFGYSLIPMGMVLVPSDGIYLGKRGENEGLSAEIYPQDKTSITEEVKPEETKNPPTV